MGDLYINDFHRSNSMAAQREVQQMSLHPYSREQKLMQIRSMQSPRTSKEVSNVERMEILSEFSEACKDIKLAREGKLQGRPLEELLDEL